MNKQAFTSKRSKWLPVWIVLFLVLTVLMQHAFLFIFIALLPSIVAYIVDSKPGHPIFISVSALNFAGLLPFLFDMGFSASALSQAGVLMSIPGS